MRNSTKKFRILIAGMIAVFAMAAFVGCSDDTDSTGYNASAVEAAVDEIVDSVAENLVESAFHGTTAPVPVPVDDNDLAFFNDMLVVDSVIYGVFDKGLVAYDLTTGDYQSVASEEPLNTIHMHDSDLYVGGKSLYKVVDFELQKQRISDNGALRILNPALEPMALTFDGEITELASFGKKLMIGTGNGLYSQADGVFDTVWDDIDVTAMATADDGLWVGTDGDGLFHWDGDKFKKRYLLRDTAIFDDVNCLDYSRGYVYVGTNDALYVFDGGKWETLTTDNGMASNRVLAVNADGWVVYVGTDKGVNGYFDDYFYPIKKFENTRVNAFGRIDNKMIAATDNALMLKKSKEEIATLIESDIEIPDAVDYVTEGNDTIPGIVENILDGTDPEVAVEETPAEEPAVDTEDAVIGTVEFINDADLIPAEETVEVSAADETVEEATEIIVAKDTEELSPVLIDDQSSPTDD